MERTSSLVGGKSEPTEIEPTLIDERMNVCGLPALQRFLGNRPDGAETREWEPPTGERETEAISEHICTDLKFSPARPNAGEGNPIGSQRIRSTRLVD